MHRGIRSGPYWVNIIHFKFLNIRLLDCVNYIEIFTGIKPYWFSDELDKVKNNSNEDDGNEDEGVNEILDDLNN